MSEQHADDSFEEDKFGCTRKCSPRTQSINLLGNLDKFHKQWGEQWRVTILDGPPGYQEEVGDLGKEPEPLSTPYVVYRSSLYAYWSLVVTQFSSEPKSRLGEPVFEPSDANSASSVLGSDPSFGCLSETRMRIRDSDILPRLGSLSETAVKLGLGSRSLLIQDHSFPLEHVMQRVYYPVNTTPN
ncbi:hypothetical protein B0H13DRAFT_1878182 [Mycena leptocephala]|nr:hypothetical protein B0H13DRAFT_1878182 [Mycena leptocephala]